MQNGTFLHPFEYLLPHPYHSNIIELIYETTISLTVLSRVASTDLGHLRSAGDEEKVRLALALRVRLGELEGVQLKSDLKSQNLVITPSIYILF